MELASMFFGFIIAFITYKQSGLSASLGIIGWLTVFWGFWIVGALISFFVMLITGFLAKWIFIILVIAFVVSKIRKK
jgi:hypothetical protein